MKEEMITEVMQQMLPYLDNAQLKQLRQVMEQTLFHYEVSGIEAKPEEDDSNSLTAMFIAAKRIEGCSEKTLKYYKTTIDSMVVSLGKNVRHILTEDLRTYLTEYQREPDVHHPANPSGGGAIQPPAHTQGGGGERAAESTGGAQ